MTDVNTRANGAGPGTDLSALRLPELQALAIERGLVGASKLRKGDLVNALNELNENDNDNTDNNDTDNSNDVAVIDAPSTDSAPSESFELPEPVAPRKRTSRRVTSADTEAIAAAPELAGAPVVDAQAESVADAVDAPLAHEHTVDVPVSLDQIELPEGPTGRTEDPTPADVAVDSDNADGTEEGGQPRSSRNRNRNRSAQNGNQQGGTAQANGNQQNGNQQPRQNNGQQNGNQPRNQNNQNNNGQQNNGPRNQLDNQNGMQDGDDERSGRSRYRDRKRGRGPLGDDFEPEITEDDILIPVAGILDVLDNYAFVRTSGYLPGNNDVYVSLGQVKKYFLRKGDAVVGAIRQPRESDNAQGRQKYNAIVRIDSINGLPVEEAANRVEFGKLTPLYPQERLRLETEPGKLSTRIIDLVSPIGKGQRGLIVSPPKAGKTLVLQAIANAISKNNPEVHLMVVLVDERPEEVTDMQRTVKGEVIASTFDRPAEDHTTVAELAIERAKRLVELGHDVVVLLDSTRLPDWAAPTTWLLRHPVVSSPAASTRPRCTRRSVSSALRATSKRVARSPSSRPLSSRPAPRWTK